MTASPPGARSSEPDKSADHQLRGTAGAWVRHSQTRWLVGILVINLASSAFDAVSHGDTLAFALELRLLFLTPLMLAALVLSLIQVNAILQNTASALASFSFIVTVAVIGQYAPEPFASRYLMSALFLLCGVALFGALPWWETKALTGLLGRICRRGCYRTADAAGMANLDLVGLAILLCFVALRMRLQRATPNCLSCAARA